MSQGHFALWHSTSASGPIRRVPPPRGSPPRCPPRAFPSSSPSSSPLSFYEAFLFPRFVAGWSTFRGGPLSLLFCVLVPCGALLFAVVSCSGADGCVSRLRSTSPSAIAFCMPSFFSTCSAVSRCTGAAVGRVSRPRSSTWTFSLLRVSSFALFTRMRIACSPSLFRF